MNNDGKCIAWLPGTLQGSKNLYAEADGNVELMLRGLGGVQCFLHYQCRPLGGSRNQRKGRDAGDRGFTGPPRQGGRREEVCWRSLPWSFPLHDAMLSTMPIGLAWVVLPHVCLPLGIGQLGHVLLMGGPRGGRQQSSPTQMHF